MLERVSLEQVLYSELLWGLVLVEVSSVAAK